MSLIRNKTYFRTAAVYLGIAAFSIILMGIYYAVDHGLRDIRMTLLFLPPLACSFMFFLINLDRDRNLGNTWQVLFHMGFSAGYLYMLLSSIITMANAYNGLVIVFAVISGALVLASAVIAIVKRTGCGHSETE